MGDILIGSVHIKGKGTKQHWSSRLEIMEENIEVLIKTEPEDYVETDSITVHVSTAIPDRSTEEFAARKVKSEHGNPSSCKDDSGESVTDSVHNVADVTNDDDVTFTGDDVTDTGVDDGGGTSGLDDETNSNMIPGTCGSLNISGPDGQFMNGCSEPFYFIQNGRLTEMKVKRASDEMQCKICGRHFPRMSNLRRHLRTHTGEKPFKCDQCDRSFSQRSHLNTHMSVHSGEKPFECNVCGRRFARQNSCAAHMTLHTGDKPHKCDYCEKSFTRKQKLTEHIRGHNI